ncbi:alpha-ribazole phosphatase [Salsuginibacillus halophilus]|uniref:phosphoglycerate mutase (2,3-diphosphoglycerate-dependent) n=1 Tax=Salsuginibacillus halophilus TaxID=517424 RepID=A0A2P8HL40_9BACI|nr:histidine phosphatase family protein [Salsuginibacillus halophilus]PSL46921.1 alpha-ribazole phosphatase [Salsuginibacillus halophilus]
MGTRNCVDLYLIRHGVTAWNLEKRYLGWSDQPLDPAADQALTRLADELVFTSFTEVYTSGMKRTNETLRKVAPQPFIEDLRLRELHFGGFEGFTYDELKEDNRYRRWVDDPCEETPPAGESWIDFVRRVDEFVDERLVQAGGEKLLIVAHGGVIRRVVSRFSEDHGFWDTKIPAGEGLAMRLEAEEGGWRCSSLWAVPGQENVTSPHL